MSILKKKKKNSKEKQTVNTAPITLLRVSSNFLTETLEQACKSLRGHIFLSEPVGNAIAQNLKRIQNMRAKKAVRLT